MKTHVSTGGILYRLAGIAIDATGLQFVTRGRYVNPNGIYLDAPTVSLYRDRFGKYWAVL